MLNRNKDFKIKTFVVKDLYCSYCQITTPSIRPEYEDEEGEKAKEDHHIVHRPEHHHQLALQAGEESDQLEDAEESEGPEDTQT